MLGRLWRGRVAALSSARVQTTVAALPWAEKHGESTILIQKEKQVSLSGVRSDGFPLTPQPRHGRGH